MTVGSFGPCEEGRTPPGPDWEAPRVAVELKILVASLGLPLLLYGWKIHRAVVALMGGALGALVGAAVGVAAGDGAGAAAMLAFLGFPVGAALALTVEKTIVTLTGLYVGTTLTGNAVTAVALSTARYPTRIPYHDTVVGVPFIAALFPGPWPLVWTLPWFHLPEPDALETVLPWTGGYAGWSELLVPYAMLAVASVAVGYAAWVYEERTDVAVLAGAAYFLASPVLTFFGRAATLTVMFVGGSSMALLAWRVYGTTIMAYTSALGALPAALVVGAEFGAEAGIGGWIALFVLGMYVQHELGEPPEAGGRSGSARRHPGAGRGRSLGTCPSCAQGIDLGGLRDGESLRCPSCRVGLTLHRGTLSVPMDCRNCDRRFALPPDAGGEAAYCPSCGAPNPIRFDRRIDPGPGAPP